MPPDYTLKPHYRLTVSGYQTRGDLNVPAANICREKYYSVHGIQPGKVCMFPTFPRECIAVEHLNEGPISDYGLFEPARNQSSTN
ncbi:hypothetical protein TNCV_4714121 [Trichonephila clavipes]|nr:hypothetical protein TNCV_4714121 [Trichonephila clavipes]